MDCFCATALFNLYVHTVAVMRLHLLKKSNPLFDYKHTNKQCSLQN